MTTDRIMKIMLLNMGIAVLNIIVFSEGLAGVRIGGASTFDTAFGITVILMSIAVFVMGNYALINVKDKLVMTSALKTVDDYIMALKQTSSKRTFGGDIEIILDQVDRLQKKIGTIKDVMLQRFSVTEMSYSKFDSVIKDVSGVFYMNIRSILNKLGAFDEHDYLRITKGTAAKRMPSDVIEKKVGIYNEYISFVKGAIDDNEEILLRLDKLLLELSKLTSLEDGELEEMAEMKGIEELIRQVKYYR